MSHRSVARSASTALVLLFATFWPVAVPAQGQGVDAPEQGAECLADSLGEVRAGGSIPDCQDSVASCREACTNGDEASCLAAAYAIEAAEGPREEISALYARACRLGRANACTNYAAGIWVRDHSEEQAECALRIFTKACAASEKFACGMVARVLLEGPDDPELRARAQEDLESACSGLGGFPCRVLAKHLEAGDFGSVEPGRVSALLAEACDGGDPDACGEPATAAETFR